MYKKKKIFEFGGVRGVYIIIIKILLKIILLHKNRKDMNKRDNIDNIKSINMILRRIKEEEKSDNKEGYDIIVHNIIFDVIDLFLNNITSDENGKINNTEYDKIKIRDCNMTEYCIEIYYENNTTNN